MDTSFLGFPKISTPLHVGAEMISAWASRPTVDDAMVIYHPDDNIRKKLVALVEQRHKLVEVRGIRKSTIAQFLRAICVAMRLHPARTGSDCFKRIRETGTPFHVSDAHLLCPDHLGVIAD